MMVKDRRSWLRKCTGTFYTRESFFLLKLSCRDRVIFDKL